ncbi:MAG: TatD family hydrolase [Bacteroidales bacterium]|nr:TatD family hydrolase [Candidatus Physcousia equi]
MFIDTHSHIYEPEFDEDREEVIQRAKEAGIGHIFLPNINAESIDPMLRLCQQHPDYLSPMLGLHPEDVKGDYRNVLSGMQQQFLCAHHPFIAIGEVGLDYYWDRTFEAEQREAFRTQVKWALHHDLPLMIHCRAAHRDLVDILRDVTTNQADEQKDTMPHGLLRGVFHCFGGTKEDAEELMQFENFALGIGGILTYKKSTLPEVLQVVPLERVVIETDAPYLAPVPHRGKRNEPAFAQHTVERLADIYGVSVPYIMEQTNMNVKRIFMC